MALTLSTGPSFPTPERRRRARLAGHITGWILPAGAAAPHLPTEDEGWEVRVYDVSRLGAGFTSTEPLQPGSRHRLRIGLGPIKRARVVTIVVCRQCQDGTYNVGAQFADAPTRYARAG